MSKDACPVLNFTVAKVHQLNMIEEGCIYMQQPNVFLRTSQRVELSMVEWLMTHGYICSELLREAVLLRGSEKCHAIFQGDGATQVKWQRFIN